MASSLPKFIALKAPKNSKYLSFVNENVKEHGLLKCSGEDVLSPYSKFEVEAATINGLVHLKCSYNNKYVVMDSSSQEWIAATADNPNEDQSAFSCTLFKPIVDEEAKTLQLIHVQLGQYICLSDSGYIFPATPDGVSSAEAFGVTDLESLFVLPKHVAFSALNDKYLSACMIQEKYPMLQFSAKEVSDPTVPHEVFITSDGSVGVKSAHFSKFWKRKEDWVLANADDAKSEDPDSLFWPQKIDKATVALRNLGNNKFCKRYSLHGVRNWLAVVASDVSDEEAELEVSEMVTSREIYDIIYHVSDTKVYNQRVVTLGTQTDVNTNKPTDGVIGTDKHFKSCTLQFPYENTLSKTWNSSVYSKLYDTVTLKACTPTIPGGKTSDNLKDFEGNYTWGEPMKTSTSENEEYKGDIPGGTRRSINLKATIVSYHVPFSYTQRDTLVNGEQVVYKMEDGFHTGDAVFKVEFETKDENLSL